MKLPPLPEMVRIVSQDLDAWIDNVGLAPTALRDLIFALGEMQYRAVRILTKLAQDQDRKSAE
jgi:hypothetical protein